MIGHVIDRVSIIGVTATWLWAFSTAPDAMLVAEFALIAHVTAAAVALILWPIDVIFGSYEH
jgi:hypothetical protein